MNLESCLYLGHLEHRRFLPRPHKFQYGVFYFYLDLNEVEDIFRSSFLKALKRLGILSFNRKNYYGDSSKDLRQEISDLVFRHTNERLQGPVRLLTNLSYFGFCFNPVSFYYCFHSDGTTLNYIVAEVTNTPWGERFQYVLKFEDDKKDVFEIKKVFHVSPFMPMNIDYKWVLDKPMEDAMVYMQNRLTGEKDLLFDSTLKLKRKELNSTNILKVLSKYPFVTLKTAAAIYYQAARLYLKRTPFYTHPNKVDIT